MHPDIYEMASRVVPGLVYPLARVVQAFRHKERARIRIRALLKAGGMLLHLLEKLGRNHLESHVEFSCAGRRGAVWYVKKLPRWLA
jgi:hypothetical protein